MTAEIIQFTTKESVIHKCGVCRKPEAEVGKMVSNLQVNPHWAGKDVRYICKGCLERCAEILSEK